MDLEVGERCYRCGAVTGDAGFCKACMPYAEIDGEPIAFALKAIAMAFVVALLAVAFKVL